MERRTRNGVWDEFLHYGNENIPCSRPRNGVPGTWNAPSFHVPDDYVHTKEVVQLAKILHGEFMLEGIDGPL